MKTENIINLAVGGAILFGTVWIVSKAWNKGQEEKSNFLGKKLRFNRKANTNGFAGLNRGISPSGRVQESNVTICPDQVVAQGNCKKQCEHWTIGGTFEAPNRCIGASTNPWMRERTMVRTR